MTSLILLDDNDASIKYSTSPTWDLFGTSSEYSNTVHGADEVGMTATLTFSGAPVRPFYNQLNRLNHLILGTFVAVYGTIDQQAASSYVIDGGKPQTFNTSDKTPTLYQQQFFQAQLEDGIHTLVVTNLLDIHAFWLDYFEIEPSLPTSSPTTSTTPSSTSSSTAKSSLNPSSAPPPPQTNALIGAAVGGTLAGVLIIALIGFLFFRWRRRKPDVHNTTPFINSQETRPAHMPHPSSSFGYTTRGGTASDKTWGSDGNRSADLHDQLSSLQPHRGEIAAGSSTVDNRPPPYQHTEPHMQNRD